MTSQTPIGPEHHDLDRRTVRDIVEYSPAQVNEVWCRKIFRRILQSLELQYGMHMPYRAITPDTVVFHDNGEPLLVPSDVHAPPRREDGSGDPLRDDLTALAGVIHYAITGELIPGGPLQGRGFTGYSDALLSAVDRCMAPDPERRPRTIDELRGILGIVPPGQPAAPRPLPEELFDDIEPAPVPAAETAAASSSVAEPGPEPEPVALPAAVAEPAGPAAPLPAAPEPVPAETLAPAPAAALMPEPAAALAPQPAPAPVVEPAAKPATDTAVRPAAPLPGVPATPSAAPPSAPPIQPSVREPVKPRAGSGLSPRQRWAIAAGGGAILVAFALVMLAELRDSGTYDQIALSLPQRSDAPAAPPVVPSPASDTAAPAAPVDAALPDTAATEPTPDTAAGTDLGDAATAGTPDNPPAGAAAGAPGNVSYRLQIQPWGVVYVDGIDRGVSPPVKRLALAPGRHTVRVTNPNFPDRTLDIDTAGGNGRIIVDFSKPPADGARPAQ